MSPTGTPDKPAGGHTDLIRMGDPVPIPWDRLKPYEQQQRGYWFYGPGCDIYGNGKQWISVPNPADPVATPATPADLRTRIVATLRNTPTADERDSGDPHPELMGEHGTRGGHNYSWRCALCFADVDALADALVGLLAERGIS